MTSFKQTGLSSSWAVAIIVVAALTGGCASDTTQPAGATGSPMSPAPAAKPMTTGPMTPSTMTPASQTPGRPSTSAMPGVPPPVTPAMMPDTMPVGGASAPAVATPTVDPGAMPWERVPEAEVESVCKLDLAALQGASGIFGVVRYGRYCFEARDNGPSHQVMSVTKTLGAVLTGAAMYQTREIEGTERKTGPITEFQPMDHWLDNLGQIQDSATVAHVLTMRGYIANAAVGSRNHQYDTVGSREINQLLDVIRVAVNQDSARLGTTALEFGRRFLFDKIGMAPSWPGSNIGYSWTATLGDMARVGLLMLNGGMWAGERLVSAEYFYAMTHPAIEDGQTGTSYGYLTWMSPINCAPRPVWRKYPHGPISMAADCKLGNCMQKHDVGVWYAGGAGGQFIFGHRGLDMVVVGKDWGEGNIQGLWDAVRPAIKDLDCDAYAAGDYAPDLKLWPGEDPVTGFQGGAAPQP